MKFPTPELETAWLNALDSNKFVQTRSDLASHTYDGNYAYCCMGVAGAVLGLSNASMTGHGYLPYKGGQFYSSMAVEMITLKIVTPFSQGEQSTLATLNDMHGLTFRQIAAFVRGADPKVWDSF